MVLSFVFRIDLIVKMTFIVLRFQTIFCSFLTYLCLVFPISAKPCHLPLSRLPHTVYINGMPIQRSTRTYEVGPGVDIEITCSESYLLDREEPTTCISQNILDPPILPKCIRKFALIFGYV